MRYFLAKSALLALLLPVSAMAEQFDLVCTWAVDIATPVDLTLRVDTDRNTVNGTQAEINEAEIRVEFRDASGRTSVTINRYTGGMRVVVSPAGLPDGYGRGICVKPTRRQF
jgi:hypothetical protein